MGIGSDDVIDEERVGGESSIDSSISVSSSGKVS